MGNYTLKAEKEGTRKRKGRDAKKKPFTISVGAVVIKVCKNSDGTATIMYGRGKDRKQIHKGNYKSAQIAASLLASELSKGNQELGKISQEKLLYYQEQERRLKGVPISVAADFYISRVDAEELIPQKVPDLFDKLMNALIRRKKSPGHIKTMRSRCGRFAKAFRGYIHPIKVKEIEKWIEGQGGSVTNYNNLRGSIIQLFRFAQKEHALLQGIRTQAEQTHRYTEDDLAAGKQPVEIYTIEEIIKILKACEDDDVLALVVLACFCGLRISEITGEGTKHEPLSWEQIIFLEKMVEVAKQKVRSKGNRHVPLQNALAWLTRCRDKTGYIWKRTMRSDKVLAKVFKKAGIRRKKNGFRHSFISCRTMQTNDVKKVSIEAGTSENLIWSNYFKPNLATFANAWFAILPDVLQQDQDAASSK